MFVDLATARFIAAEKENEKIAVEIKSFIGRSQTAELEQALGQFSLYYAVMTRTDATRKLYLAVPDTVFDELFEGEKGEIVMSDERLRVFCFSTENEEILKWKR